jgi:DNA-directed RNA polymerase subunit RPC12/RpoP
MEALFKINRKIHSKIGFCLPIPIENHYYKFRRTSFRKRWFCKTCYHIFNFPKEDILMSELTCPDCNSRSIAWSKVLSKAIIDKKPIDSLLTICNKIDETNDLISKRINYGK